ncbi:ATP-binding protein [Synergistales bacterium]|nr:ATP-binding protein [Synergistales bacterium]
MALSKLSLENFTVFDKLDIEFSKGVNVFIGENGTGKTHIMKVLYSACQAAQAKTTAIDFQTKLAKVFRPNDLSLHRLVKRGIGVSVAKVQVVSEQDGQKTTNRNVALSLEINSKFKDRLISKGENAWSSRMENLTSTFIPAKDILSNSYNLIQAIDKGNVDFDDTYKDIISSATVDISKGPESSRTKKYLSILQKILPQITPGTVSVKNDKFYLKITVGGGHSMLEFQLVAEGIRKIALLWQLIKNGTLEKGSVLFWDEPEANINPVYIPVIADMLLELQRDGVQIFIATHDYFITKYLDVRRTEGNDLRYFSLYKDEDTVLCDDALSFRDLKHNAILDTFIKLYEEEVEKVMR